MSIIPFDEVKNKLNEQIKAAFVLAIPPEKWDEFIAAEWKKFTEGYRERVPYSNEDKLVPSQMSVMVQEAIAKAARDRVQKWAAEWVGEGKADSMVVEALTKLVEAGAEAFLANVGKAIVAGAMTAFAQTPLAQCRCGRFAVRNTNCACGQWIN